MTTLRQKLSNIPNLVYGIVGAIIVLGSIAGGAFLLDDRYAHAEQTVKSMIMLQQSVEKTNAKIDLHAMQQQIDATQQQMWKIEDRTGTTDPMAMPIKERERYRALAAQKDTLSSRLKAMEASINATP